MLNEGRPACVSALSKHTLLRLSARPRREEFNGSAVRTCHAVRQKSEVREELVTKPYSERLSTTGTTQQLCYRLNEVKRLVDHNIFEKIGIYRIWNHFIYLYGDGTINISFYVYYLSM